MTLGGSGMSLDMCGILGAWMLLLVACGAIKKKCLNKEEGRENSLGGSLERGESGVYDTFC